ncbi:transposase [Streptomyces sp. SP2-10]|nr:transposase [Streptomyces sp. SP2-10]
MGKKKPRPRRSLTPEFKAEIVELCRRGDRSVGQVAKDFDLTETAVRDWVKQAEVDAGERDGLTSSEREELAALGRENRRLREDVEVLKRATAFFAKEGACGWKVFSLLNEDIDARMPYGPMDIAARRLSEMAPHVAPHLASGLADLSGVVDAIGWWKASGVQPPHASVLLDVRILETVAGGRSRVSLTNDDAVT